MSVLCRRDQDDAILCKYCKSELKTHQSSIGAVNPTTTTLPGSPVNENLSVLIQKYIQKGYKLTSSTADRAILEKPAAQFNSCTFFWLIFAFGIGALVYAIIFWIWANHKAYSVQLILVQMVRCRNSAIHCRNLNMIN